MFEGRRVLVVVPARGGSKGVKLKNLREVGGVPLVALAGHVAKALPWVDRAIVAATALAACVLVVAAIARDVFTTPYAELRDCACGPGIHHPARRLRTVKH